MTPPGPRSAYQHDPTANIRSQYPDSGNGYSNTYFFTRFGNYLPRYPAPQTTAQALYGPAVSDLQAIKVGDADQGRGLYYVSELPGVATIITMSSYTYTDTYTTADPMYKWLKVRKRGNTKVVRVLVVNFFVHTFPLLLRTFCPTSIASRRPGSSCRCMRATTHSRVRGRVGRTIGRCFYRSPFSKLPPL